MDDTYIKQHDIAQKYIQGELTPEESTEFEVYLMDRPELVEELELDTLFKNHIPLVEESKRKTGWFLSWFSASPLKYVMASSVTFVLGVLVSFPILFLGGSFDSELIRKIENVEVVYVSNVRNINNTNKIEKIILSDNLNTLIVAVNGTKNDSYFVSANQIETNIFDSAKLEANNDGDLFVPIPVNRLKSGVLNITYQAVMSSEENTIRVEIEL